MGDLVRGDGGDRGAGESGALTPFAEGAEAVFDEGGDPLGGVGFFAAGLEIEGESEGVFEVEFEASFGFFALPRHAQGNVRAGRGCRENGWPCKVSGYLWELTGALHISRANRSASCKLREKNAVSVIFTVTFRGVVVHQGVSALCARRAGPTSPLYPRIP